MLRRYLPINPADFDYFMEERKDILISGGSRSIPDFYGATPPDVNSGEVEVKGYELVLGVNHTFANKINLWSKFSFTNASPGIFLLLKASAGVSIPSRIWGSRSTSYVLSLQ